MSSASSISDDPWVSWLSSDAVSLEAQAFTRALQMSLSQTDSPSSSCPSSSSIRNIAEALPAATSSAPGQARRGNGIETGRIAKRKAARKRGGPLTTYINADPENFMAMVQQMTGGGVGSAVVVRPEPTRRSFQPRELGIGQAPLESIGRVEEAPPSPGFDFDVDSFFSFPPLEPMGAV